MCVLRALAAAAREGAVRRSLQLVCLLACCLELELELVCLVLVLELELDLDLVASERARHASYPPPPALRHP